jgi:peptidoglycan/xylan/chitin deacetylase (PgdA/CDA1 family)
MTGARSAILTYHSLDESGSVISIPPILFRRQMEFLAASGIPVVSLNEALSCPGSVAVTFDDGYRNLLDHAIPVLERYRLPATIFIVSEYCGRNNNWPNQPHGSVPDQPLLSWEELSALPPLISVGAHAMTHPDLTRLSAKECDRELGGCQVQIEQRLRRPVRWLAYPYGASSPQVRSLAGQYFDLAVGTSLRFLSTRSSRLDLPRIDAYYLSGRFSLERLFTAPASLFIGLRRLLRDARRFAFR